MRKESTSSIPPSQPTETTNSTLGLVQKYFTTKCCDSDQRSFKAAVSAGDLENIFKTFTSFITLKLDVKLMFDSAIVGIVTEEVKKPENDLFFCRTNLKDKVSTAKLPSLVSGKVLKKKVKFEIYERKVCSALTDDEKANARNQLQNEVQERIDSTVPGFGPGFDTHVKYYIDKFGDDL